MPTIEYVMWGLASSISRKIKQQAEEPKMPHKNIKSCSAVLVVAAMTIGQAQAGGRGSAKLGASPFAPGHGTPVSVIRESLEMLLETSRTTKF